MQISATLILIVILVYFLLLIGISFLTSRNTTNQDFYVANKQSPWFIVAFGMIGASLSGVTFISIPGTIGAGGTNMAFSYMQMVFGYLIGYFIIATILLPIYYKMNLTSIYGYLDDRFGTTSYKMGSIFFLLSRVIGASFRLYLVAIVLHQFVLGPIGFSFALTVLISILLIWTYTFAGGIKTIIWTDTLQTICMLGSVILTLIYIGNAMDLNLSGMIGSIKEAGYGQMFFFENGWSDPNNFYKQVISGALIALVMTGLDQDMMQKNLSCRSLRDAQKNVFAFSIVLVFANLLFIGLGAMLYIYANSNGIPIPTKTDQLFPTLALNHFSPTIGILFILGLIAAAYSSADSALTSLTTSFSVDILGLEKKEISDEEKTKTRRWVHIGFSLLLFLVILSFNMVNEGAVINGLFKAAGYTYGPILGMFSFGIFTNKKINDKWVWIVCLVAPVISYILNMNAATWFGGFTFGFLILAVNGILTFLGLWLLSIRYEK